MAGQGYMQESGTDRFDDRQDGPAGEAVARDQASADPRGAALVLSRIVSTVMSPLLMPFFAVMVLLHGMIMGYMPAKIKTYYTLVILLNTCVVPVLCIGLLHSMGVIRGLLLATRRDRVLPLLITALCYAVCAFMVDGLFGSFIVSRFLLAGAACIGLAFVVTLFWKISIHMLAAGGTFAIVYVIQRAGLGDFMPVLIGMVAACGALASARLYIGAHTPVQVAAGFLGGFSISMLVILL